MPDKLITVESMASAGLPLGVRRPKFALQKRGPHVLARYLCSVSIRRDMSSTISSSCRLAGGMWRGWMKLTGHCDTPSKHRSNLTGVCPGMLGKGVSQLCATRLPGGC